jgi:hypothetical protein
MNRLQAELLRLYHPHVPQDPGAEAQASSLIGADGRVRAMVLELARPADWDALSALWRGVQADMQLPAPAIAVSGIDGYQLWFSLAEAVSVADAQAFLESLRLRYLANIPTERIGIRPAVDASAPRQVRHASMVPALQAQTGRWSAFVAPDLAALFADEPWLDLPPGPEAQAELLSRLESIKPADFQQAMARLRSGTTPVTPHASADAAGGETGQSDAGRATAGQHSAPKRFLLEVMNDRAVELRLRIEAAKALLPYFEDPRQR